MDEILNPTIYLGNFEWREPITTLTDFMVAIVASFGYYKFKSYKGIKSSSFTYFKFYFLCFAVGMTSAAWLGHGLASICWARIQKDWLDLWSFRSIIIRNWIF